MANWSRETPWRQGRLLKAETIAKLGLATDLPPEKVAAIIATHDCDLAQSADSEPTVELILGRILDAAANGNYTNCKNLRRLHVGLSASGEAIQIELDAGNRCFIPKENPNSPEMGLSAHTPSETHRMTPREHNTLQHWLSARYRRAAFPDEFDRRLKEETGIAERLARAFKDTGHHIPAIFFDVDAGEELARRGANDPYELFIVLLYSTHDDPAAAEAAALEAAAKIEEVFKKHCLTQEDGVETWKWIELQAIEVVSDHAMTYAQSQLLKKWQADHISLRSTPEQAMLGN